MGELQRLFFLVNYESGNKYIYFHVIQPKKIDLYKKLSRKYRLHFFVQNFISK